MQEWYFTVASPIPIRIGSPAPTYATQVQPRVKAKV